MKYTDHERYLLGVYERAADKAAQAGKDMLYYRSMAEHRKAEMSDAVLEMNEALANLRARGVEPPQ